MKNSRDIQILDGEFCGLGDLLDTCAHAFSHRVGGRRQRRAKILQCITDNPGVSQRELAEMLGVQPASVSELLIKLEQKGFVRREKLEADHRSIGVFPTEEAAAFLAACPSREDPFQVLSDAEREQLEQLLQKLITDWQLRYPHQEEAQREHSGHHGRRGHHHGSREGQAKE